MQRFEAIAKFLREKKIPFANLSLEKLTEMELQMNVGQDGGEKVNRKFSFTNEDGSVREYNYQAFTYCHNEFHNHQYGLKETWKSFRIPYRARETDSNYTDKPLRFSTDHFEAVGLSGWNWKKKESEWVGFDFDSIANHQQGLNDEELNDIRRRVEEISWVTSRRSTSGKGLHFYIYLSPPIPTISHTEHAGLARAILGIVSARIGKNLEGKVDVCGGILWVWHRRQSADGYTLIKEGSALDDVPTNWRDHVEVVKGKKRRIRAPTATDADERYLEELIGKTRIADLDDGHRKIIGWLVQANKLAWWDQDRRLLVAHTFDLQECHRALKLKGPFYTSASGKETGNDQNCFAFPLRNSGWVLRRHTRKCAEHPSWTIDPSGWTRCYFNMAADLSTAARCHGGVERSDGRYEVSSLRDAFSSLQDLGAVPATVASEVSSNPYINRPATLREHKDGRAIVSISRQSTDKMPEGWYEGTKNTWERLIDIQNEPNEIEVPDNFVRHLVTNSIDAGWYVFTRGSWIMESPGNVRKAMIASGTAIRSIEEILGQCVLHPWFLANRPFQPEYPGNRTWNRNAPQYAFDPVRPQDNTYASNFEGVAHNCPTWWKILTHCGEGLDEAVSDNRWCRENGVKDGRSYLFLWIASMFTQPSESLPYLFFYSEEQNTGKSTFHEALSLLFKGGTGYVKSDVSLTSSGRFNAELACAVLCVVEETNLSVTGKGKEAYNRIKDWVTSPHILIHEKGKTPYQLINNTHWVQCSNDADAVPIFPGDTRIVVCRVVPFGHNLHLSVLDSQGNETTRGKKICRCKIIPDKRNVLMKSLEIQAPYFLWYCLNTEIPVTDSRLRIPVISSSEKEESILTNENPISSFLREKTFPVNGSAILLQDLHTSFLEWIPFAQHRNWPYPRFIRQLPNTLTRGKYKTGGYYAANISFRADSPPGVRLIKILDKIVPDE